MHDDGPFFNVECEALPCRCLTRMPLWQCLLCCRCHSVISVHGLPHAPHHPSPQPFDLPFVASSLHQSPPPPPVLCAPSGGHGHISICAPSISSRSCASSTVDTATAVCTTCAGAPTARCVTLTHAILDRRQGMQGTPTSVSSSQSKC